MNIPNARISSWKFGGQWFEGDFCVLDIHIFDFSLTNLQSLDSLYTMIINFNHLIVFSTNNFDDIKWFQLLRFRYFFIRLLRYRYMSVDDNTHDTWGKDTHFLCTGSVYLFRNAVKFHALPKFELYNYALIILNHHILFRIIIRTYKCDSVLDKCYVIS